MTRRDISPTSAPEAAPETTSGTHRKTSGRLVAMDGLRFAAAAAVLLYHFTATSTVSSYWGTDPAHAFPVLNEVTRYGFSSTCWRNRSATSVCLPTTTISMCISPLRELWATPSLAGGACPSHHSSWHPQLPVPGTNHLPSRMPRQLRRDSDPAWNVQANSVAWVTTAPTVSERGRRDLSDFQVLTRLPRGPATGVWP